MNIQELLSEAPRDRTKKWEVYTFAVLVTVATLGFRLALDSLFGGHPTLIIFILPILLSGFVGGLRAGLLATAISYLSTFCLLPPIHSFRPVAGPDHWPQFFVVLLGIVISLLNEAAVRRAHHQAEIAFRLSEDALVKAETIQNAVCNCSSFSCIATDAKGVIQYFNVGAEHMFGYKATEVVGRLAVTSLHAQEEVEARARALSLEWNTPVASTFEAIVYKASQEIADTYEVTKVRKDGSRFPASVSVTALRDANFLILGFLLIATDNTLRQRVEVEREKTAAELHNTNVKLELARAAAEKANQAKSEFLSNMSHELRTPLNAILGFAQLMETSEPAPSVRHISNITQILNAGWYLLKLINEVLDLAAIESNKLVLMTESVSLDGVLETCRHMVEPQAQLRGIKMIFTSRGRPLSVRADRTRLEQILINLLSNAVKYNKDGGTVTVDCVVGEGGRVRIRVKDTGAGLPPEKLTQLFTPFNRLGQESGDVPGTGIGLVVSKRLTEAMGGTLGVESIVGEGSIFYCELYAAETPSSASSEMPVAILPSSVMTKTRERTLLYVEDNPANLRFIEELTDQIPDLKLITAVNAAVGLELVYLKQPNVILMDINLPGINGLKALRILQEDPVTSHLPVIALSANAMIRDIENGLKAGFFSYLTKPVKITQFNSTLEAALKFGDQHPAVAGRV